MSSGAVLGFECEWFDGVSGVLNVLFLKYFLDDNTIEILLEKSGCLLKRIYYPDVVATDLFVGNSITVFNRLIVIKGYANIATTRWMKAREVHFLVLVSKEGASSLGNVYLLAKEQRLKAGRVRTVNAALVDALSGLGAAEGDFLIEFVGHTGMSSTSFVEASQKMGRHVLASILPADAMNEIMAIKAARNVGEDPCTLCIIKPHIMREENAGAVLNDIITEGFTITGIYSTHLTQAIAEELFDVYRDIYPTYTMMIEHLCSTPLLAVMISSPSTEIVEQFREFTGPLNPELARNVRPTSLRAKYGKSAVCNALHCSDLPEDGAMECRYFFELLAGL